MQIINLIQGSQEWHDHRAKYFNASDAPAMMGKSLYKTRDQLLHERHTGLIPEVSEAVQRRFADGHKYEKLALPLAEEFVDEDLYPVTGVNGIYSASFDGLTMEHDIAFEHKTLNEDLREIMHLTCKGTELPLMYQIQMEHQLMVSGADSCLFMASKWDGETLVEKRECWYRTNPVLRQQIIDGWLQFESDLANYAPVAIAEPVKAQPIKALPSLSIAIKGEVTLSNLPDFQKAAKAYIANISTELVTDEDFAQGAATVTFCKEAEARIEATKAAAIAQTASIDELMRTLDFIKAQFATKRLELDKLVKSRKEQIKLEALQNANVQVMDYLAIVELEIKPIKIVTDNPAASSVISGLKTLKSMHSNLNTWVAACKIKIDQVARDLRDKLAWHNETAKDHLFLFNDMQQIIYKPMDDFELLVKTRISDYVVAEAAKNAKASEVKPDVLQGNAELPVDAKPVPVPESLKPKFESISAQQFDNVRPEINSIIKLVSINWNVSDDVAIQWLASYDFKSIDKPF